MASWPSCLLLGQGLVLLSLCRSGAGVMKINELELSKHVELLIYKQRH